ncbi:flavodoxin domain-containing protein [Nocardia sp. NPDC003963]
MTAKHPRIAVLYATEEGSTRDIAEFVAAELADRSADVELHDIDHAPDPSRFDSVVLGSAVHEMDLLPEAGAYLRNNREQLDATDVRLFSVGLGPALRGPLGQRIGRKIPPKIAALRDEVAAADYHAFAGHYERAGISRRARIRYRLMGGRRYGDLRDWSAIRKWTTDTGDALGLPAAETTVIHP